MNPRPLLITLRDLPREAFISTCTTVPDDLSPSSGAVFLLLITTVFASATPDESM
jgi:hypothetical protein